MDLYHELRSIVDVREDRAPIREVTISRDEARRVVLDHEDIEFALEEAQNLANEDGQHAFLIIKIRGAVL